MTQQRNEPPLAPGEETPAAFPRDRNPPRDGYQHPTPRPTPRSSATPTSWAATTTPASRSRRRRPRLRRMRRPIWHRPRRTAAARSRTPPRSRVDRWPPKPPITPDRWSTRRDSSCPTRRVASSSVRRLACARSPTSSARWPTAANSPASVLSSPGRRPTRPTRSPNGWTAGTPRPCWRMSVASPVRRPGTFLLGAALAGLAAGRLTRAGVDNARSDDDSSSTPDSSIALVPPDRAPASRARTRPRPVGPYDDPTTTGYLDPNRAVSAPRGDYGDAPTGTTDGLDSGEPLR